MKAIFEIITYDVWGNPKDGWEINDMFRTGRTTVVNFPADLPNGQPIPDAAWRAYSKAYDRAIVRALRKAGEIKSGIRLASLGIDGESDYSLYITDERRPASSRGYGHGKPVIELRRVKEGE